MKLHVIRASHNCRRVLATVEHLGLDVTIVEPNPRAGDLKAPEFLALNPNGKVPTLEDGDFRLWESNAIMQYLASQHPNDLWPDDARIRADIARWQFWEANHFSTATGPYGFEMAFKPMILKQEPDKAAVERAIARWHVFAPVLNGHLEGRSYLVGDGLTLADFSVGADLQYSLMTGIPADPYPNILAWWQRLGQIKAWQTTAPKL